MLAALYGWVRGAGLALLTLFLALISQASAQSVESIRGRVLDSLSGAPVAQATVTLSNGSGKERTDELGSFSLTHVPLGVYSINIVAPGYYARTLSDVVVREDVTREITIHLQPRLYPVDGITVVERRELRSDDVAVIRRAEIERSHSETLGDLLETVPGLRITYAGAGNEAAHISIRGSSPEQVLVLVDGHKLNGGGQGAVDLNSLPLALIERVEVHRGGNSARYGPDAMAGVINIVTQRSSPSSSFRVESRSVFGTWNSQQLKLRVLDPIPSTTVSTKLGLESHRTDGAFDFNYTVQPRNKTYSGTRVNNQSEKQSYFLSGQYRLSPAGELSISSHWYEFDGGLPGPASQPTPDAHKSDDRKLLTASWLQSLDDKTLIESRLGLSRYEQHFSDVDNPSPLYRFDAAYCNDIYTLSSAARIDFGRTRLQTGVDLRRDELEHDNHLRPQFSMGQTLRRSAGLFAALERSFAVDFTKVWDRITFDLAGRYDYASTDKDSTSSLDITRSHEISEWSPKFAVALSRPGELSYTLRASYGKSFRLPSINALFWQGDVYARGNPGLRPERSEHSDAGIEVRYANGPIVVRAALTYYHKYVSDLIVWARGQGGAWQPYNLAAARLTGHEDWLSVELFDHLLALEYSNTITTSRNRSGGHATYDRELTFTPHYIQHITLRFNHEWIYGFYRLRHVGKRYALENNQKYFDAYSVADASVGARVEIADQWRVALEYDANNLTNEQYVLVAHYPMPPREWSIGVHVEFGNGL